MNFDTNNPKTPLTEDSEMQRFEMVEYEASLQRLGGDKELFVEFIDIFMSDSPKMVEDICEAVDKSDPVQLEKSAHALKGLMLNFGAKACCDSALAFEIAGRENNLGGLKEETKNFRRLYEKLCGELSSFSL